MYSFTRPWDTVAMMLPHPGSYLLNGVSRLWPDLTGTLRYPGVGEQQLFPGIVSVIAVAWFCVSRKARLCQPLAAPMLATAGILVVLTLNLHGHTIYRLIYDIPGFVAIRVVARIILVIMLPISVLCGMLIDSLADPVARLPMRYATAATLSMLLVAECSLVRLDVSSPQSWRAANTALEARLPKPLPPNAILAIAMPPGVTFDTVPWVLGETADELLATTLGIPTLNGYGGNTPPGWQAMATCANVLNNIRTARHFLTEHGLPAPNISPDQLVLVGFSPCDLAGLDEDPRLALDQTYYFARGAAGSVFLANGFAAPESWGAWTDAGDAYLYFSLARTPDGKVSLTVDALSLSRASDRKQAATVFANGRSCGRLVVTQITPRAEVACPADAFHAGSNTLLLRVADPTSPMDLGISADPRRLGIGLRTLRLEVEP